MAVNRLLDNTVTSRGNLSYSYLEKNLSPDKVMVDDYLGISEQSNLAVEQIDLIIDQIDENTENIEVNATSIQENADNLTAHENSNSQHGVTGLNVGTEDYASELVGGVVLMMQLVNDAVDSSATVTLADIGGAPTDYTQSHMQLVVEMVNETKAKHNQLLDDLNLAIAQFNGLLAKAKTAKQMVL